MPGGTTTTFGPISLANEARMAWSDMPDCSIFRIFFLLSQQVRQGYGSMRQAILVLQPQGQFKRSAMRFTAGLSSSSADWAAHSPANQPKAKKPIASQLVFNRRMFLGNSYYLRPGVRQTNFIGNQANDGAEREHPKSDPDPRHQREDIGLDDSALVVGRQPREINIEILVQASPDGYLRGRLLAGLVEAPLGIERAQRTPVARHVHRQPLPGVGVVLALLNVRDVQVVMAHVGVAAGRHFLGDVLIERRAGVADEHEHDAHVDQIAAVAPGVAVCQFDGRGNEPDAVLNADG